MQIIYLKISHLHAHVVLYKKIHSKARQTPGMGRGAAEETFRNAQIFVMYLCVIKRSIPPPLYLVTLAGKPFSFFLNQSIHPHTDVGYIHLYICRMSLKKKDF